MHNMQRVLKWFLQQIQNFLLAATAFQNSESFRITESTVFWCSILSSCRYLLPVPLILCVCEMYAAISSTAIFQSS